MVKIAVDIDEVLSKTSSNFFDYFNSKHDTFFSDDDVTNYDFDCFENFSQNYMMDELISFISRNIENLEVIDYSKEVLENLKEKGNELFVVTSRSLNFEEGTRNWIEKNFGTNLFSSINLYNQNGQEYRCKAEVVKELGCDILIEDAPKYIENAANLGIKVFAMNRTCNKNIPFNENIIRVSNWEDIRKRLI